MSGLRRWPPEILRQAVTPLTSDEAVGAAAKGGRRRGSRPRPAVRAGVLAPAWLDTPSSAWVEEKLGVMEALDADLFVCGHPGYPAVLGQLHDPPPFLWTRGTPWAFPGPRVGIVGSRAASSAGLDLAHGLARDLALSGVEVWSGLARGIDGAAHRGALSAEGRTGAVLGTGLDGCYPPEHAGLLTRIVGSGGLVTEFPPNSAPLRYHFPRRNRILAALVHVLVVVEGGARSGARSTVDHALDLGREVVAVPRDPVHPGSALPNSLLQEGAVPVLCCGDVLAVLPPHARLDRLEAPVDRLEAGGGGTTDLPAQTVGPQVRAALEQSPATVEDLARTTGQPIGVIQSQLLELELVGEVERAAGGRYRVTPRRLRP